MSDIIAALSIAAYISGGASLLVYVIRHDGIPLGSDSDFEAGIMAISVALLWPLALLMAAIEALGRRLR